LVGKQRNILKKRKAPLSIQEVYKGNQTRSSDNCLVKLTHMHK
jgi:3-deoxy-D-manno-octulosonate 8-phosphate phosphatase KdsC-like HAD superfamily phosphatase